MIKQAKKRDAAKLKTQKMFYHPYLTVWKEEQ